MLRSYQNSNGLVFGATVGLFFLRNLPPLINPVNLASQNMRRLIAQKNLTDYPQHPGAEIKPKSFCMKKPV